MRFGDHWRVLLSHLILFGFVYPDKRENVPAWVMDELIRRLGGEPARTDNDVCYGTLLSREQYLLRPRAPSAIATAGPSQSGR